MTPRDKVELKHTEKTYRTIRISKIKLAEKRQKQQASHKTDSDLGSQEQTRTQIDIYGCHKL